MAAHDKARHLETAPRHELGQSLTPHRHRAVRCVNDLAVTGIDQHMARGVQEIAAPQLGRTAYCHDLAERVRCMSVSRNTMMPRSRNAFCTSPEQSSPKKFVPPHKYGQ